MKPGTRVSDADGVSGVVEQLDHNPAEPGGRVFIRWQTGLGSWLPVALLTEEPRGSYRTVLSVRTLEQGTADTWVIPVIREELKVSKRTVDAGGVRIIKSVHEHEEVVDQPLLREEIDVERVPMQRMVDGPIPVRHEGEVMIVSLLEEVLVVKKRLMLREEVRITRRRLETHAPQQVTLRSEEVVVERIEGETSHVQDKGPA